MKINILIFKSLHQNTYLHTYDYCQITKPIKLTISIYIGRRF